LRYTIIDNFLNSTECKTIIDMARLRLEASTTWSVRNGVLQISDYRRADQMFFKLAENETIRHIEEKVADITHVPIENGEGLQVVRYREGGYYKAHYDYFDVKWRSNQWMMRRGGQRIITVLMYLNSLTSAGGETYFPYTNLKIEPVAGKSLIWYNVDDNGEVDPSTFHEAKPVKKGEKLIATKWLREHKFQ
jgi:prolyl 4-hydroxylase